MQKYNKYKKQYLKDPQTIKSFHKLPRKVYRITEVMKTKMNRCVIFQLSIWRKQKKFYS